MVIGKICCWILTHPRLILALLYLWYINIGHLLDSHLHVHAASQRYNNKDRRTQKDAGMKDARRKTQEDFFTNIFYLSLYCKSSKGLFKGLHVRGCWRLNINFIFWPPLLMTSRCVFLVLLMFNRRPRAHSARCWFSLWHLISIFSGPQTPSGFLRTPPLGRVWLSLPHLVSNSLEFYWQLLWHPELNWVK